MSLGRFSSQQELDVYLSCLAKAEVGDMAEILVYPTLCDPYEARPPFTYNFTASIIDRTRGPVIAQFPVIGTLPLLISLGRQARIACSQSYPILGDVGYRHSFSRPNTVSWIKMCVPPYTNANSALEIDTWVKRIIKRNKP